MDNQQTVNLDRVPLSQLVQKEAEIEGLGVKKDVPEPARTDSAVAEPLSELKDMKALRVMFGFDGLGFDGHGEKAQRIYEWAKNKTGLKGGPQVLYAVKKLITKLGISEIKGTLLTKLAQYVVLDSQIEDLKVAKKNI